MTPQKKENTTMAGITERLERDEWNPAPGDILAGTVAAITERSITTKKDGRTLWFPVITVAYRRGEEPLSVPIALLAHYALGLPWLAEQTYLRPFPPDLRLRHSVSVDAG